MKTKSKHTALKSFLTYIAKHKLKIAASILCFLIADVLLALVPVFIGKLTGALAIHPAQGHLAIIFAVVLIGLSTGHNLMWRVSEFVYLKLVKPLSFYYENILFEKTIRQPYPYFVDKFTGKISSYVTNISQEFHDFLDNLCFNYTAQLVNLIALTIILSSINWQTGLVFIIGLVCMVIAGRYAIRNSFKKERIAADVKSTKNGKIVDAFTNFVNVKSFRKETAETQQIQHEQVKTLKSAKNSYVASVILWATMSFFIRDFIWPVTIGLNVYLFLHGHLTITQLATMLSAILLFSTSIWDTVWFLSEFNLKMARAEEAHAYLFGPKLLEDVNVRPNHIEDIAFNKEFVVNSLHFAYPDKPGVTVLKNINLTISKGEKVGIVGKSGSGKTTLTKLLLDYYEIQPDALLIDGNNVSVSQIAQLISYVPQDTSLFHRSIADNIAYAADRQVNRQEIIVAAKQAHADEFIAEINEGYDALVGERGVKLSAGQRQRIAIARAFLDDKPILVLDEATSALDSESEVLVQKALEDLWEHKTVIAIAHRLSTLRQMDRIIVLESGKIVEEGSHQELLASKGVYAKLWAHQSGGFLED